VLPELTLSRLLKAVTIDATPHYVLTAGATLHRPPLSLQSSTNVAPWHPTDPNDINGRIFVVLCWFYRDCRALPLFKKNHIPLKDSYHESSCSPSKSFFLSKDVGKMLLVIASGNEQRQHFDEFEDNGARKSGPLRKRRGLPKVHSGCVTCK
jgi:hypothetical protein